jgi:hypothetical protein
LGNFWATYLKRLKAAGIEETAQILPDGATPAMAANISKSFWTLKDLLEAASI